MKALRHDFQRKSQQNEELGNELQNTSFKLNESKEKIEKLEAKIELLSDQWWTKSKTEIKKFLNFKIAEKDDCIKLPIIFLTLH